MTVSMARNRLRVLYICGDGRTGSTLLSGMLDSISGFVAIGEMRGVWRAIENDELCGCGQSFSKCAFWQEVGVRAFRGWEAIDVDEMLDLDRSLARHRKLLLTTRPRDGSKMQEAIDKYVGMSVAIYRGIQEVSGASIIVDSTKDVPYGVLLSRAREIDLGVIHLVRDSRGVVYSWGKVGIERPEYAKHPTLAGTFMRRRRPGTAAAGWAVRNSIVGLVGRRGTRVVVRYEDLVTQPRFEINRIVSLCRSALPDSTARESAHLNSSAVGFGSHSIGGNRIRFQREPREIRPDEEWQTLMRRRDFIVVTASTFPWLMAFGYRLGRGNATL